MSEDELLDEMSQEYGSMVQAVLREGSVYPSNPNYKDCRQELWVLLWTYVDKYGGVPQLKARHARKYLFQRLEWKLQDLKKDLMVPRITEEYEACQERVGEIEHGFDDQETQRCMQKWSQKLNYKERRYLKELLADDRQPYLSKVQRLRFRKALRKSRDKWKKAFDDENKE